jgi:hypothetical protein
MAGDLTANDVAAPPILEDEHDACCPETGVAVIANSQSTSTVRWITNPISKRIYDSPL